MWVILTRIADRLGSSTLGFVFGFFTRHAGYVQNLEENLAAVKTSIDELTASKTQVLQRVRVEEQQQKRKRLEAVKLWFGRVEKAVAEAQELIQSGEQELQRLCLGGYFSTHCWSTSIFGKEVHNFRNLVRDLLEKPKEFDQVTAEIPAEELVVELPCDPTVGLQSKLDEIWTCLENKDVVGVYGIGGVGKTTLLTQLHNKFVDTKSDVLVIWVVVGKDAPPEKIQENIANKLGFPVKQLGGRKFVLFLDDIWKRIELTKIGIPTKRKLGSKIIFSTRSLKVCHEMGAQERIKVDTLELEDAWELFRKHAGEDTIDIDAEILPLAKSMADKCGGLPIALKVVGRAMSGKLKPQEWRHSISILKRLPGMKVVDELLIDMEIEVFEVLKFSYASLANDKLRSCFLYCALYPDDYLIKKDVLVGIWICEDFWDDNGLTREASDEAHSIIDTLVRSCLLEDEGEHVKMHDVIRDMALWLEEDNFLVMTGMELKEAPRVEKWEEVKRLSLMTNRIEELIQVPTCHKLVTLFLNMNLFLEKMNEDFFHFMGALTVLDLSFTYLRKLPNSIEKLVSLEYLNIERTVIKELPVELAVLSKLKSLDISDLNLKAKRSEGLIYGMSSLQVLKMVDCSYDYGEKEELSEENNEEILLDELERLEHLKVLHLTVRSVHNLGRLSPKLLVTITTLCLKVLKGSRSLNICLLGDIKYLSQVQILQSDMEEIHDAAMERSAAVGSTSVRMETIINFSYLRIVHVSGCNYLKNLTVMLLLLPNLTTLQVFYCDRMEEIISGVVKLGEEAKLFSKLSSINLRYLENLRCIYQNPLPFPLLRDLSIIYCPLLTKLPFDSNSRGGPKIRLESFEKWWKEIEWKDDATKAVLLPRFKRKIY